jgi:hypothetical protein
MIWLLRVLCGKVNEPYYIAIGWAMWTKNQ